MANFSKGSIELAIKETQGRCGYCGCELVKGEIELDHVIPRSMGGTSSRKKNILAVCTKCNRSKNDSGLSKFKEKLKVDRFFFEELGLVKGYRFTEIDIGRGLTIKKGDHFDPYKI